MRMKEFKFLLGLVTWIFLQGNIDVNVFKYFAVGKN